MKKLLIPVSLCLVSVFIMSFKSKDLGNVTELIDPETGENCYVLTEEYTSALPLIQEDIEISLQLVSISGEYTGGTVDACPGKGVRCVYAYNSGKNETTVVITQKEPKAKTLLIAD